MLDDNTFQSPEFSLCESGVKVILNLLEIQAAQRWSLLSGVVVIPEKYDSREGSSCGRNPGECVEET